MLKKLRIQLTLLYLVSAVFLALTVGGVTYSLVSYYFQTSTDHALKVKMGLQFAAMDIPLPVELYSEVRQAGLVISLDSLSDNENDGTSSHELNEGLQETELADIYVVPLTSSGTLVEGFLDLLSPALIDQDSVRAALLNGSDLRTIKSSNGIKTRIITYKVPGDYSVQVFQMGRYLTGQNLVLSQLLRTMIILGVVVTFFISVAAWFLAGKTIRPTQQAWDRQQTFVANASHELRAPLTLIRAGVEVALKNSQSDSQRQLLNDVLLDSDHMNNLIEDLLLLSRLDVQGIALKLQTIEMKDFFPMIIRQLELAGSSSGISILSEIENIKLHVDPLRLKQIVLILVDNALKHTPHGGQICISSYLENGFGLIKITDTGTGIPDEYLERVFDRFFKVPFRLNREKTGHGLGLSIAKSLLEAQNGTIEIKNRIPQGVEVVLKFPISL